nr:hypothetical protein [Tolivirales sp.]
MAVPPRLWLNMRTPDNTVENVLVALATRVFIARPAFFPLQPAVMSRIARKAGAKCARRHGFRLWTEDEVRSYINTLKPSKRSLYNEALDSSATFPRISQATIFAKDELGEVKVNKLWRPRMIAFRRPEHFARSLFFYRPLIQAFTHAEYLFDPYQRTNCLKGMNYDEWMAWHVEELVRLGGSGPGRVMWYGIDCSAWDAHCSADFMKAVHEPFESQFFYSCNPTDAQRTFFNRWQVSCRSLPFLGRLRNGIVRGNVQDGCLGSGEARTDGNTYGAVACGRYYAEVAGFHPKDWALGHNGDDGSGFVKSELADAFVGGQKACYDTLGHSLTQEGPYPVDLTSMETISFCQCRPVYMGESEPDGSRGWRFVRDPRRAINVYSRSTKWYTSVEMAKRYWASIGEGELRLNSGVPIMQSFYARLLRAAAGAKPIPAVLADKYSERNRPTKRPLAVVPVKWETRLSFEKAFRISVIDQLIMEEWYDSITDDTLWQGFAISP